MKKIIISALIGALFGGAVVFATMQTPVSQQNQIVANAKGLPETVQQTPKVVENTKIDIIHSHYSKLYELCVKQHTKQAFDNTGSYMTTGLVAGCYQIQNQFAENELEQLLSFENIYSDDSKETDKKLSQWIDERDSECEKMVEQGEITSLELYSCISDSTISHISSIYNSNNL
ncbi:MAG: hypothetical protein IJV56_03540 [Neisseriaceae bacterium]|nr:hypothetical protein [Neisseriaceae bacterium]MBQ9724397.1 hypothetical protein [Neisseriaceae bacterium]MBR1819140.1 hypothetical protein [Neisseriaceae bacterium]